MTAREAYPYVEDWQWPLLEKYGDRLNNTGGNLPADLLNRMQDPGGPHGNRLASTNVVVFTLACCQLAQLHLLADLERSGDLS